LRWPVEQQRHVEVVGPELPQTVEGAGTVVRRAALNLLGYSIGDIDGVEGIRVERIGGIVLVSTVDKAGKGRYCDCHDDLLANGYMSRVDERLACLWPQSPWQSIEQVGQVPRLFDKRIKHQNWVKKT
jgi:hypothetical protein